MIFPGNVLILIWTFGWTEIDSHAAGQRSACVISPHWSLSLTSRCLLSLPTWLWPRWMWTTWPWWWPPTASAVSPTTRGSSSRTPGRRCPSWGCSSFTWTPVSSRAWCRLFEPQSPPRALDHPPAPAITHPQSVINIFSLSKPHWKCVGWDVTPFTEEGDSWKQLNIVQLLIQQLRYQNHLISYFLTGRCCTSP